jgi:pantoate--beta-alanine ligase
MLRVVPTVAEWRALRAEYRAAGKSVGFVPTMGGLHAGHASLFKAARRGNDVVLASIFVNPSQFDEKRDFELYPRPFEKDSALMDEAGVDVAFVPTVSEMYPGGAHYTLTEDSFSRKLCGEHRHGHFAGVLTVVMKLLQIADAERAYFGEKDRQQLELVRGMCRAFFLRTEIIPCPTVREPDGLAMSSRNARLSAAERALAPKFHSILTAAGSTDDAEAALAAAGFTVDYVADHNGHRFGAVRLGQTRLIDNVAR